MNEVFTRKKTTNDLMSQVRKKNEDSDLISVSSELSSFDSDRSRKSKNYYSNKFSQAAYSSRPGEGSVNTRGSQGFFAPRSESTNPYTKNGLPFQFISQEQITEYSNIFDHYDTKH